MNWEEFFRDLSQINVNESTIAPLLARVTEAANALHAAQLALKSIINNAHQAPDAAIKELLAAELALRNSKVFSQTQSHTQGLLATLIQKRHVLETQLYQQTQKKKDPRKVFEESSFETIEDDENTSIWQAKAKAREDKRKRREQREQLIREMQTHMRKHNETNLNEERDSESPVLLYENVKRQARFIPKRSFAWACVFIGVSENATLDEGKNKYRERAKLWHPDTGTTHEKDILSDAMASLNDAWKIFRQNH